MAELYSVCPISSTVIAGLRPRAGYAWNIVIYSIVLYQSNTVVEINGRD